VMLLTSAGACDGHSANISGLSDQSMKRPLRQF
jgi:hypothetical protein